VISQLEKMDFGEVGNSSAVFDAVSQLLTYMPLLDLVDTKCRSAFISLFVNCNNNNNNNNNKHIYIAP